MRRLIFSKANHQLESRIQEIWQSGSEGGAKPTFVPTPIATPKSRPVVCMFRSEIRLSRRRRILYRGRHPQADLDMRSSWLLLARSRIWLDCLSSLRSDAAAFSLAQSVARPLLAPSFLIDSGDDCGLDGRFVAREQLFECCHQFPFAARPTPIQNARLQMSHIPISVIHPSEPGKRFMINDRAINRRTFSTIFCLYTQGASDVEAVLRKFSER